MLARRMYFGHRIAPHYSEDDGSGAGSGGGAAQRLSASDLLARNGASAERLAEKLEDAYADNYKLREKNRSVTAELTAATAKIPGDGAIVLSGDDAKSWEAYKALGVSAEDAAKRIKERDEYAGTIAKHEREKSIAAVASVAGMNATVLADRAGNAALEVREVDVNGTKTKIAYIKPEGGEATPLADYAGSQWPAYLPALMAAPSPGNAHLPPAQGAGLPGPGINFPSMPPSNGTAPTGGNLLADFLANRDKAGQEAPNILKSA